MKKRSDQRLNWFANINLLLLACILMTGCNQSDSHTHSPATSDGQTYVGKYPIKVVCTTGQVTEMLTRIGGEHIQVQGMMGPGLDPHLYSPTASDVDMMLEADAIFYNGMHLEGRMADKFVQLARSKATYPVTEGVQIRKDKRLREPPEFEGMYDPHVWHDVALWADCVHDVADFLGKFDPKNAKEYDENAHAYMEELTELHEFCKTEVAKIPESARIMITAHDAFGYFGAAYGVEVAGLKGISSEEEKDLAHQDEIQAMILERKIPAVFVESAIAHRTIDSLIETCRAAGWEVVNGGELYADALGEAGSEASSYTGMVRHNVKTIVEGLSK